MTHSKHQELFKGLVRLHILHHAVEHEVYGQWMMDELARHGYTLTPRTIYPMLDALERNGYLKSRKERLGRSFRRLYKATPLGRQAHQVIKTKIRALFSELIEGC